MRYQAEGFRSYRIDDDGSAELMANFVAEITKETRIVDGMNMKSVLTISGEMPGPVEDEPVQLPEVEVAAEDFPGMNWVMANWGVRCVIRPGSGIKDDMRAMIQLQSEPEVTTIYRNTGWQNVNGQRTFLHAGGGITKRGNNPNISVRLPNELSKYNLTSPATPEQAVGASMDLLNVAREDLTWPLLAATLCPVYGPCDFAVHLTGRTGSFKSELTSLFQSHYGAGMDARSLPGSWSSTPNALEALAFLACNCVFVVDDFVPAGTSWQQRAYQQNADKLIRAQGNQAGRARLSDTAHLQQTMYPRGLILSTGEDTPEGHSVRARMLILEVAPGEVETDALTAAQAARPMYPGTVAWLAQSLAAQPPDINERVSELRAGYRGIGHSRTPGMLAKLVAVAEDFLARAAEAGLMSPQDAAAYAGDAKTAIEDAGAKQQSYLEDADPVDIFCAAVRQVLASGGGHLRTLNGGVPLKAELLGWTSERSLGELATYKSRGPCIGWVKWPADELYLDITAGFNIVRKAAGNDLSLSKQTLFKRMKDSGVLLRVDDSRQRNTIRVTAENHPRQVICLSLSTTLDIQDTTDAEASTTADDPIE